MFRTVIFSPFVSGHRNGDRAANLAGLELVRELGIYTVLPWPCDSPLAYATGLEWARERYDRIITVEHDMAVHPLQIAELATCPHPECVFAYYVGNTRDGDVTPELAHRKLVDGKEVPIVEGDKFADRISLGLAKIDAAAWEGVRARPMVPRVSWRSLAWELSVRLSDQWHVHWPAVAHHHWNS